MADLTTGDLALMKDNDMFGSNGGGLLLMMGGGWVGWTPSGSQAATGT